jgi:dienelactone hydrolase
VGQSGDGTRAGSVLQRVFRLLRGKSSGGNLAPVIARLLAFTTSAVVLLWAAIGAQQSAPALADGEEVVVKSGALRLKALMFRPKADGLVPAVVFHHGGGCGRNLATALGAARALGNRFAARGYAFLWVFRRGAGLSSDQGECATTEIARTREEKGDEAAMDVQLRILTTTELDDAMAGLATLCALPGIDATRIVVGGHSFGGQLAILAGERDGGVRAIVAAAAAAAAWNSSPKIRARLMQAVGALKAPIYLGYAEDDNADAGRVLGAELARLGKPHLLAIYPTGGHGFVFSSSHPSDADLFRFLATHVSR